MSRIDPTLKFGERELIVVRQYVRYSFPAMRNSRPLGLVIAGLFSVAVVLSLIGLVLSAVDSSAPLEAWFKTGLFWVTQTIGILLPGEGGLDAEMKKTGRVSNRFRVRLKGVETL